MALHTTRGREVAERVKKEGEGQREGREIASRVVFVAGRRTL